MVRRGSTIAQKVDARRRSSTFLTNSIFAQDAEAIEHEINDGLEDSEGDGSDEES